jgi:glycosyltransferase involved in cell wall biosynthesis
MDLSYLHFPETFRKNDLYQLTKWTEYSVKKAKKVITISNSSKNDIIKYYKVKEDKVKVVYLGLKNLSMNEPSEKELSEFGVNKKFILFVGTLQPRKNISRLIEAFSKLSDNLKDEHQLVVIGKKGWLYEDILSSPEKFHVSDKVLFLDYVSDDDLPNFYKKAELFVLPSLYEGFGLPVLEAMRYGCPVVTSNVSSLPEAGGDAALYFKPEDVDDIKNTIEKVLTDKSLKEKMIEKGRDHYKKFTWEKAAKEVLGAIEEIEASSK